jgi:two-component system, cell cycle response regulator DivK
MTRTVLVADDHEDIRIIFATILQYGGYRVLTAVDGLDAVRQARLHRPALILMDLAMPRMDGWAAIAELQRDGATVGIPVLAVSAHGTGGEIAREARQAGCVAYLAKPVVPQTLLAAVQRCLDGPQPGPAWSDRIGPHAG